MYISRTMQQDRGGELWERKDDMCPFSDHQEFQSDSIFLIVQQQLLKKGDK